MRIFLMIAAMGLAGGAGCARAGGGGRRDENAKLRAGDHGLSIRHDGRTRPYRVHVAAL
jgi:hypothetical protein